MFVLVEGIHDAGKSTLVENLVKYSLFNKFQCRRLFSNLVDAKSLHVSDFSFGVNTSIAWFAQRMSKQADVVFDRLHLSEYAYSIIFRNINSTEAYQKFEAIDDALFNTNMCMIHLTCDYQSISERKKAKNMVYNEQDYTKLIENFEVVLKASKIKSITIDTGKYNKLDTFEFAIQFLETTKHEFDSRSKT